MLAIKNVYKLYAGKTILHNMSLSVDRGEIALLLGPSGVGKSTLLRILNNLETIDSGIITVDGKPLDLTKVNTTHTVGMVFQQFNLFEHLTVIQNITLALEKVIHKTHEQALAIAHKLLTHYGLDQKADSFVSRLSGGQKQRLAIARAVALKPTIICMDEPTSALDPLLTTHVANTITELAHEKYIILIASHDTALLDKLNCTIYLLGENGIVQTALSQDFRGNPEKFPLIHSFVSGSIQP
ncbi:MAG: ATP-binding cassette domain-containing protein [Candidatus Dependentiae bacterium]|nr:ATP-binding cassette domain-containing protein [Candidatus Dependentiae bacterium]